MTEIAPIEKPLILIVDDMPTNIHMLATVLKDEYRIKTATSGHKALEIVQRIDKPELILLDVMMPEMSGIEMLRILREMPEQAHIPVIFISADTSEQSQLDGLDLGADDYLTKPIVKSILLARVRNILQRKRAETQLRLAAHVFQHSGEAIMITNSNNLIVNVNTAFERMTGYFAGEIRGKNPHILSSGRTSREEYEQMWRDIHENGFWQGEMWDRHKNGKIYPKLLIISVVRNRQGNIDFYIGSFSDISQQKETEERIRHLAHHDPLTQLPNRLYLQVSLEQLIHMAQRNREEIAVMFIDLDRFKVINDTLGHNIGDGLLIEVSQRLKVCVRDSDVVARLGGDEFVILLMGENVVSIATVVSQKILHSLTQTYYIEQHPLHTSPSIGISVYPHDGTEIDVLMKKADTAMYHVKSMGRNNFQFFDTSTEQHNSEKLALEHDLHEALEKAQFHLHYQPQICAKTEKIIGVEALLRWQHPKHGNVPPNIFIPLAEDSGLIVRLGEWVLKTACAQLRAWRELGIQNVRMAVNLSLHQLRQATLIDNIAVILQENNLKAGDLELEITESVAMKNPQSAIELFNRLREIGIELAIDDFGTGYSSLAYLKLLPIQRLKIDKAFVKDVETNKDDAAICLACIALAHSLGIEVVAEGVETKAQQQYLQENHGNVLQGFYFYRPMPADIVVTHLLNHS